MYLSYTQQMTTTTMSIMVSEAASVEKDCPICMEVVELSVNCLVTECGHTFHTSCFLNNVLHNGFGCPYCRRVLVDDVGRDEVADMRRREIERRRNEEQGDEEDDILNQGFYEEDDDEEVEDQGAVAAPHQQDIANIDMEIPEAQIEEIEEVGGPPVRNWLTEGLMEVEGEGVGGDEDEGMEMDEVDEMMEQEHQMSRNNMMPSPHDLAVELQRYGFYIIDYVRIILDAHYEEEYRGIIGDYNLRHNIDSLRTSIARLMHQYREEARIEQEMEMNIMRQDEDEDEDYERRRTWLRRMGHPN